MTLQEVVDTIEAYGYRMIGKDMAGRFPFDVLGATVLTAPLALMPKFTVVEGYTWCADWMCTREDLSGYRKIEGAAAVKVGDAGAIVHLQFVPCVKAKAHVQ